jgi:PilZ domain-containing protein
MDSVMSDTTSDRRRARRHARVEEHGIVAARVRPGHAAALIDVSADGALIETTRRLLPGASVELLLDTREVSAAVRGRVVRCTVSRVRSSSVCYRGAISFDRSLPWFVDDDRGGYDVPSGDNRSALPTRAEVTRHVL